MATSPPATTVALRRAAELACDSGAPIVLLVPCVTTFTGHAGRSGPPAAGLADEFRELAARAGVNALVQVCVCRRIPDIVQLLAADSCTVVLGGGRGRWFRPTAELRLARILARHGHSVVFEDLAHGTVSLGVF